MSWAEEKAKTAIEFIIYSPEPYDIKSMQVVIEDAIRKCAEIADNSNNAFEIYTKILGLLKR